MKVLNNIAFIVGWVVIILAAVGTLGFIDFFVVAAPVGNVACMGAHGK